MRILFAFAILALPATFAAVADDAVNATDANVGETNGTGTTTTTEAPTSTSTTSTTTEAPTSTSTTSTTTSAAQNTTTSLMLLGATRAPTRSPSNTSLSSSRRPQYICNGVQCITYDIWYSAFGWDEFVEITECQQHCTVGCRKRGYWCNRDRDCCSGYCRRGQCARKRRPPPPPPPPQTCSPETSKCKRDSDCCQYPGTTKVICQQMGQFGSQCYRPNVCTKENDSCNRDSDCCGSMICQVFGNFGQKCYRPATCSSVGSSCNNGKACCAGSECMNLLGGSGAVCQKCVAKGETCNMFNSPTERCCGGRSCQRLLGSASGQSVCM